MSQWFHWWHIRRTYKKSPMCIDLNTLFGKKMGKKIQVNFFELYEKETLSLNRVFLKWNTSFPNEAEAFLCFVSDDTLLNCCSCCLVHSYGWCRGECSLKGQSFGWVFCESSVWRTSVYYVHIRRLVFHHLIGFPHPQAGFIDSFLYFLLQWITLTGPNLNGLFGRQSGTTAGYSYSSANKNMAVIWGENTLYDYLLNPKKVWNHFFSFDFISSFCISILLL